MKFRLLRDLPGMKIGHIVDAKTKNIILEDFQLYQDWFEEIKEEREIKYPDNLMNGYFVYCGHYGIEIRGGKDIDDVGMQSSYVIGNRFPTKEKAEQYIALRKHIALVFRIFDKYKVYKYNQFQWDIFYKNDKDITQQIIYKEFIMPVDSTLEELAEREKLLRAYYGF